MPNAILLQLPPRVAPWALGLVPMAALAAEMSRALEAGELRFWFALAAVQVLAAMGYGSSSLPEWARWKDDTGGAVAIAERRLKIIQGLMIAMLAGNVAYFGGYYYAGLAEVTSFLIAAVAAYGGDKFLSPILTRITGKAGTP